MTEGVGVYVFGADVRVDCFTHAELMEMFEDTKDFAGATYVGAMLFMAKESPLLFLAGKVPPTGSAMAHCVVLKEYDEDSELGEAFRKYRSTTHGLDDVAEISLMVTAPPDN